MFKILKEIRDFLVDLIFPAQCVGCQKEGVFLCPRCFKILKFNLKQVCPVCRRPSLQGQVCFSRCQRDFYLDGAIIALTYQKNDLFQKVLKQFKYRFSFELKETLGLILADQFQKHFNFDKISLVPVPLHPQREKWRGFNQAQLLAEEVGKKFGRKVRDNFLIRVRNTRPQADLNRAERLSNLIGAFGIQKKKGFPQEKLEEKVVLIDDVFTTGATLNECAKVLKENGVKEVWGLVLGRGT